jgi:hypothetical protein
MVSKLIIFSIALISIEVFSQEGVITVLEAPVFFAPDSNSKVIQYHRKGATVYVHPAEFSEDFFKDDYANKVKNTKKDELEYNNRFEDVLFENGKVYTPDPESKFVKTLTRSAVEGYILKQHIFLLYKDDREFDQKVVKNDPTDYRIDEPLPKNYPLKTKSGFRGQAYVSLGTPMGQAYPYSENINDTGYDFNKEFTFIGSKQVKFDQTKRLFFGGMFNIHTSTSTYLTSNISAEEGEIRLGIGPFLSYDIWKTDSVAINVNTSLLLNIYNTKTIKQKFTDLNISETREYKSTYFSPRLGSTFIVRDFLSDFDFVSGVNITLNLPHSYETSDKSGNASKWEESFSVGYFAEQTYFIGIQTDY